MAEFFTDISAVGNEYQDYADTPAAWAVPQDGNGKAGPGHLAAVPVAEVTFAAIPTTGVVSVYGVNVTLTGVLSAASTDACATGLASSINATTTATGSSVCQLLLPLNRFVYARVKPSFPSVVQIMCRIAGGDLNGPANTSAQVTNTFNNSAMTSPVNFTGGADGPFAYIANATAVFGKTAIVIGYGLVHNEPASPTSPTSDDFIHVRTERSGVALSLPLVASTPFSGVVKGRYFLFDDGTVWSGDDGEFLLTISCTYATSSNSIFINAPSVNFAMVSRRGRDNLRVKWTVTGNSSASFQFVSNGGVATSLKFRMTYEELSGTLVSAISYFRAVTVGNLNGPILDISGSKFIYQGGVRQIDGSVSSASSNTYSTKVIAHGLDVEVVSAVTNIGPVFIYASTVRVSLEWVGGSIYDTNGLFFCQNPISVTGATKSVQILLDCVSGITDPSVGFAPALQGEHRLVWNSPEGNYKGFRLETQQFSVDWKGDGAFPYEGTAADLRGVSWSHRILWTTAPSRMSSVTPVRLSKFNRTAAAVKTVTMQLYVPDAQTFYKGELRLTVTYVDSAGGLRTEVVGGSSFQDAALDSSAASWTANSAVGHSAKQIALTTVYAVKQDSEVAATLSLCVPKSAVVFYLSPEIALT